MRIEYFSSHTQNSHFKWGSGFSSKSRIIKMELKSRGHYVIFI